MSIASMSGSTARSVAPWAVLGLGIALVIGNIAWMTLGGRKPSATAGASDHQSKDDPAPAKPPGKGPGGLPETVTLSEGKLKAARIECAPAKLESLPAELSVPGRIDANQDRQVAVRPRATGVIREVKATLGQSVKKGDVLAVLDSADVATARLNLRAKQRELATARFEAEWRKLVADNVATLVPLLGKRAEAADIIKMFAGKPLGVYRSNILEAYSKFDIAAHEEEKTRGLRREKIIGEHPEYLAIHGREGAQAVFEGTVEQSRFDAEQQSRVAAQQVRLAEAAVIDAAQRLRILGVSENVEALLANASDTAVAKLAEEDVAAYPITAPFDGTVIARHAVISQKAEVNDELFTVADLSSVWVTANIPESDFALLPQLKSGNIRVLATAYPGRALEAKLLSVGATVDPTTRTVSMLAETRNPDGLLKIGMFVRIMLDTAVSSYGVTVPAAAVVEIEGAKIVFEPSAADANSFKCHPVKTGRSTGDRLEIVSGVKNKESVVVQGAFELKSELILQNESGDE